MTRASDLQHGRDSARKTPPTPNTCATCKLLFAGFCARFDRFMDEDDGCIKGWTPK